ncbi:MAG: type IIA DNA topoisomerase subunit B [Chloroflexi bacterium]|nr:type IIA DNA topoisomerase subunit B [Chloroflexota bacterium]
MADQISRQTEEDIRLLRGLEAVRLRPGMYVGGTDIRALHHMIYEVVDNSIDEALAGRCSYIEVVLQENGAIAVNDDGGGIPVGMHKDTGTSTLEVVMTNLHAGGKFSSSAYKVSGGLHGVGISAVNALSEQMVTEVRRDGRVYTQEYRRGVPQTQVEMVREMGPEEFTGTKHLFMPDFSIMERNEYSFSTLAQRFREMAFVTRGVTIYLRDERVKPFPREMTFYFEGGLRSFVRYLNRNRPWLHDPVSVEREILVEFEDNGSGSTSFTVGVEVAFQFTDSSTTTELYFANTIHTPDGGSHQAGFRAALTRTINLYARKVGMLKEKDANFSSNDTLEGLTVIVSVKHPNPQFESQTKVKLMNPEVQGVVSQATSDAFMEFLEVNPRDAKRIIDQCMTSMRARDAAKKARDLVRRGANLLENTTLPGKLADCSEQEPAKCELYIVEGDSAGGSAKQGRDRHFQAILPLRGKILNTERARLNKILDNNEVKALISALGVGIGDDFNLDGLRYGRVIIMTDADVDGAHIRTLLLTFFFRYMTPLITNSHLYIAQPPLYLVSSGKEKHYAYTESDRDVIINALKNPDKANIQRYKGLGEMNPDQLWETTMDPAHRTLLLVTIEDAAEADRVFDMLMGSSVPPRRRFITTHAKKATLDV